MTIHITDPTPAPSIKGRGRGGVCNMNLMYFLDTSNRTPYLLHDKFLPVLHVDAGLGAPVVYAVHTNDAIMFAICLNVACGASLQKAS